MADAVDTLRKAFEESERVIAGITPEDLSKSTPCSDWDLRALLNHTVGAVTLFAVSASGQSIEGFDSNAERIGDDPLGAFQQASAAALQAWGGEGVLEGMVTLPPGQMPGAVGININLFDTYVHAWDIAQATGQAFSLAPELARWPLTP